MAHSKEHSAEAHAKNEQKLADLRNRKQQIALALRNPATIGTEYTVEELEKESEAIQAEIDRISQNACNG